MAGPDPVCAPEATVSWDHDRIKNLINLPDIHPPYAARTPDNRKLSWGIQWAPAVERHLS